MRKCIAGIIWWSTFEKQLASVYTSTPSATLIFLIVSHARIVLHEDFDSYLSNLSINVTMLHQSEVPYVGK